MPTIDDVVVALNIVAISALVAVIATWAPVVSVKYQSGFSPRARFVAIGLVVLCAGEVVVRTYSFTIREFGYTWLSQSIVIVAGIAMVAAGALILALAYFLPDARGSVHYRNGFGVFVGALTAVSLITLKLRY